MIDLMLAAEIGKSLLENNIRLKTSYEDLLQKTQRAAAAAAAPLPTPSSSLDPPTVMLNDSGIDSGSEQGEDDGMRFVPSHRTREAMIEVLERKNVELTKRLEAALAEKEAADRKNVKKTRQLEAEIEALKSNLDIATTKIQELEEMNERQRRMQQHNEEEDQRKVVDELLDRIDQLRAENEAVSASKAQVESQLARTLRDLKELKNQFEQFQFTQKEYETLQEAYERQFRHVAELKESVEEHRSLLQKLKDRGVRIYSASTTPAPSVCHGRRDSVVAIRNTLLGELESEWLKQRSKSDGSSISQLTEKPLSAIYNTREFALVESVLSKATGIDKALLDEALSFISRLEDEHDEDKCLDLYAYDVDENEEDGFTFSLFDHHHPLYPSHELYPDPHHVSFEVSRVTNAPRSFLDRLRRLLRHFFRAVLRWCRFAVILTTAVLISVWQGPDGMMIDY